MLKLPALDNLNAAAVKDRLDTLAATVDSFDLGIETSRGPIRDLVLRMHAIFEQATSDALTVALTSAIPALAVDAPNSVDADILAAVAKSAGISKYAASNSTGAVKIIVSSPDTLFITVGTVFTTASGDQFATTTAYAAKLASVNIQLFTERQLVSRGDGTYEFTIELTSVSTGSSFNIKKGTPLTPANAAVPNFVSASASSDFFGGLDSESVTSLLSRIQRAQPAKTASTRASIAAYLGQPSKFPNTAAISVIGAGDREMTRDKNTMFPGGSKVDIYARTGFTTNTKLVTLPAVVTAVTAGVSAIWSLSIPRTAMPGFYRAVSVAFTDSNTPVTVTATTKGVDVSPIENEQVPEILTAVEGAFSRFQTATITFTTPSATFTVGDTKNVNVLFEGMPLIAEMQTEVGSRSYRFIGGDVLVKAPVPCFVSGTILIALKSGVVPPDPETIRTRVAAFVNEQGFCGRLYSMQVGALVQALLPPGSFVQRVELVHETIMPNGTVIRGRSADMIEAVDQPTACVTGRTVAFFADASAISVQVLDIATPAVV